MAMFWSYFRDFVGVQKIEDLTESKTFFSEVLKITSRFVLAKKKKKKLGLGAIECGLAFSVFLSTTICVITVVKILWTQEVQPSESTKRVFVILRDAQSFLLTYVCL